MKAGGTVFVFFWSRSNKLTALTFGCKYLITRTNFLVLLICLYSWLNVYINISIQVEKVNTLHKLLTSLPGDLGVAVGHRFYWKCCVTDQFWKFLWESCSLKGSCQLRYVKYSVIKRSIYLSYTSITLHPYSYVQAFDQVSSRLFQEYFWKFFIMKPMFFDRKKCSVLASNVFYLTF